MSEVKKDYIFYGLLTTSLFFMAIGIITMTYSDTVLLNSKLIGIIQTIAGLVGILHCYNVINNQKFITYIIQLSMTFRICSYVTELFYVGYRPALLVGAMIWTLIWAGYLIVNALINGILQMQTKEEAPVKGFEPLLDENSNQN